MPRAFPRPSRSLCPAVLGAYAARVIKANTLTSQQRFLLAKSGAARGKRNAILAIDHPMPRQSMRLRAGVQQPGNSASALRLSGQGGNLSVGGDFARRDFANPFKNGSRKLSHGMVFCCRSVLVKQGLVAFGLTRGLSCGEHRLRVRLAIDL